MVITQHYRQTYQHVCSFHLTAIGWRVRGPGHYPGLEISRQSRLPNDQTNVSLTLRESHTFDIMLVRHFERSLVTTSVRCACSITFQRGSPITKRLRLKIWRK